MQLQLLPAWGTSGGHDSLRLDWSTLAARAQQPYNHGLSWHCSLVVQPFSKILYIAHWTGCSDSAAQPLSVLLYSGRRKCPLKHVIKYHHDAENFILRHSLSLGR